MKLNIILSKLKYLIDETKETYDKLHEKFFTKKLEAKK